MVGQVALTRDALNRYGIPYRDTAWLTLDALRDLLNKVADG